jgi:putative restriction endonuclease
VIWTRQVSASSESNDLALCVLHHKLLDPGTFTINAGGLVLVSDQVHGTTDFQEALLRHHGTQIRPPQRPEWSPAQEHLDYHKSEVFKGEARHPAA